MVLDMGYGGSKVDDYPLVTLCRERKELIRAATEHRYALASAHISYFRSLRDVGDALRQFVDEGLSIASTSPLDSPGPPRPAPPSPPSPKVSAWDFLNPFDSYDSVYPSYYSHSRYGSAAGSSPDSKEVREREGIPDLEDETGQEVTKEVYRNGKKPNDFVNKNSGEGEGTLRSVPMQRGEDTSWKVPSKKSENTQSDQRKEGKEIKSSPDTIVSESSEEGSRKKKSVSFEEPSVRDIESSKQSSKTTLSAHGTRDLKEVVKEIRDEFETASGCWKEVSMLLEVGKLPYQARGTLFKGWILIITVYFSIINCLGGFFFLW